MCLKKFKQDNTLIPWFLSHTANRNQNCAGKYGRLDWNEFFGTITTNLRPDAFQVCTTYS